MFWDPFFLALSEKTASAPDQIKVSPLLVEKSLRHLGRGSAECFSEVQAVRSRRHCRLRRSLRRPHSFFKGQQS